MGWTPRKDGEPAAEAQGSPSRSTVRRRRQAREAEAAETPLVQAARDSSPRLATGDQIQPPAKRRDTRISRSVQLGDRWSRIVHDVRKGEYTWQEFTDGLSEEELARGQLKAEDGTFTGRPPAFVPREFLLACQREQKRRFEEIFGSEVLGIATEYIKLCKDNSIPGKDRAKLMQYAMERIFGGIPRDVRISQEQPWEQMMINVTSEAGDGTSDHVKRRYAGYAERLGATDGQGEADG